MFLSRDITKHSEAAIENSQAKGIEKKLSQSWNRPWRHISIASWLLEISKLSKTTSYELTFRKDKAFIHLYLLFFTTLWLFSTWTLIFLAPTQAQCPLSPSSSSSPSWTALRPAMCFNCVLPCASKRLVNACPRMLSVLWLFKWEVKRISITSTENFKKQKTS